MLRIDSDELKRGEFNYLNCSIIDIIKLTKQLDTHQCDSHLRARFCGCLSKQYSNIW